LDALPILYQVTNVLMPITAFVLILVVITPSAMAQIMNPGVFPPDSKPYGYTFAQWSEKWWQWYLSIPAPENPGGDTSGRYCAVGQTNPNVWFLTGAGSGTYVRTCNIPASRAILFQPAGNECSFSENPSLKAESELRTCAISGDQVSSIHVTLDGRNIQNLQNYIVQTPLFDFRWPENNISSQPAGPTKAVSHAYVIMLKPLAPGKHELHFDQVTLGSPETGTGNFAYDITYHLEIS
jgi:hypothetical protein